MPPQSTPFLHLPPLPSYLPLGRYSLPSGARRAPSPLPSPLRGQGLYPACRRLVSSLPYKCRPLPCVVAPIERPSLWLPPSPCAPRPASSFPCVATVCPASSFPAGMGALPCVHAVGPCWCGSSTVRHELEPRLSRRGRRCPSLRGSLRWGEGRSKILCMTFGVCL